MSGGIGNSLHRAPTADETSEPGSNVEEGLQRLGSAFHSTGARCKNTAILRRENTAAARSKPLGERRRRIPGGRDQVVGDGRKLPCRPGGGSPGRMGSVVRAGGQGRPAQEGRGRPGEEHSNRPPQRPRTRSRWDEEHGKGKMEGISNRGCGTQGPPRLV